MQRSKIALAQIRPRKGDYDENLRRVGGVFAQLAGLDEVPDIVVFPETVMSGYFLQGGVSELAVTAGTLFRDLSDQLAQSGAPPIDVVVGFYEVFRNRHYNSALYATLGGPAAAVTHVHRKIFLPTYGVFDEERFVEHGNSIRAFDTRLGRVAIAVCEDVWHSIVPTLAALDGAQLIIVPSASPARGPSGEGGVGRPATVQKWEALLRRIAEEHGVYVALAQLVGFEGGKGFQGGSTVVGPNGDVVARGPAFEEALVLADIEPRAMTRARAALPLLADLETQLLNLLKHPEAGATASGPEFDSEDARPRSPAPVSTGSYGVVENGMSPDPMAIDAALTEQWLVEFLRDEVIRRRGFEKVLVGLSGGVDSATTAALAVRALGPRNVVGVWMPYRTSSEESRAHADQVARELSIELRTIDISEAVDAYAKAVGDEMSGTRRGNVMARMRMITLFDLSAKLHALPLGTGNKTERLFGYFTWHADDSPPVNPLGDLFKTQIRALASHLEVPQEIVEKPSTADLVPGQTDEEDLGITYGKADRILYWILKGYRDEEIVARGLDPGEVEQVRRRLQATHWKRSLPTVAMMSDTAIGESYLRPVDY